MATEEEIKQSIYETGQHILEVNNIIYRFCAGLTARALTHDASKLESPELEMFAEYGPKLKRLKYGSDEYKEALEKMGPALDHHYRTNRHHPEFSKRGVDGMTLIDLIEMVCDWAAATKRMKDGGDLRESLKVNAKRFDLSPQLVNIIFNSIPFLTESPVKVPEDG